MRELWTSDSLGLCGWPIYDRKEAHESNAGEGGAVAHSPPWTGVVEARDEDGIVSHPEEQLNPNRSSIPRKTSRYVAQLMSTPVPRYPCTCCGAWKYHFTPVAGISRFHARKARPGARKVVYRSLSTICSASPPPYMPTHCNSRFRLLVR